MLSTSYVITRVETVVSVVMVGKLPDNLPPYISRELILFQTPEEAVKTTKTTLHQTFILELEHPALGDTGLINGVYSQPSSQQPNLQGEVIQPEWIKKIYLYSKTGETLIRRFFNGTIPKPFEIKPE